MEVKMNSIKIKEFFPLTFLFTLGLFLFPVSIFGMEHPSPIAPSGAKIILVLGTSSSGKSTICARLSGQFSGVSLLSMDSLDDELDEGLSRRERQQFPQEWITSELCILCKKIITQASSCNIMIVDAILQESSVDSQIDQTASFIKYLRQRGLQVYALLVHCPILQLVQNVSKRNRCPRGIERRSPVAVVEEYVDTYLSSSSPSPLLSRAASGSESGSACGSEVAHITSSPNEFVNSDDLERVLAMFSQMQVDPALEVAKGVLLARLRSVSSSHTPLPVEINDEDYNFIFHNNSSETFDLEFSRLITELSAWLAK